MGQPGGPGGRLRRLEWRVKEKIMAEKKKATAVKKREEDSIDRLNECEGDRLWRRV